MECFRTARATREPCLEKLETETDRQREEKRNRDFIFLVPVPEGRKEGNKANLYSQGKISSVDYILLGLDKYAHHKTRDLTNKTSNKH